jgi:hypothetical protein
MHKRTFFAALAALVFITGCNDTAPAPEIKTTTTPEAGGWKRVTNEQAGISVQVPESWIALDLSSDQLDEIFKDMETKSPQFAKMGPTIRELSKQGMYKMFIIHKNIADDGQAFADNINVVAQDMPAGVTLQEIVNASKETLAQMGEVKAEEIPEEPTKVGGHDAIMLRGPMKAPTENGVIDVQYLSFHMLTEKQLVVVTATAPVNRMSALEDEMRAIVNTIEIR